MLFRKPILIAFFALSMLFSGFPQFPIFDDSFGIAGEAAYDHTYTVGNATSIGVQSTGKIVITSGNTIFPSQYNGFHMTRLNLDGSTDLSFGESGFVKDSARFPYAQVNSVWILPDDKILVTGSAPSYPDHSFLNRYLPDGSPDPSFGNSGSVTFSNTVGVRAVYLMTDNSGKILVLARDQAGQNGFLFRFLENGTKDNTFGNSNLGYLNIDGGGDRFYVYKLNVDHLNRYYVVGESNYGFKVLRFLSEGLLDNSFGTNGLFLDTRFYSTSSMDVDFQGEKIIVSGRANNSDYAALRLNYDGTIDDSFGNSGAAVADVSGFFNVPYQAFVKGDGKIMLLGFGRNGMTEVDNSRLTLVQFNPDGSQDLSFGNDGVFYSGHQNHEKMICGVLLPDGSLLAGGYKAYYNYNYSTYIPVVNKLQTGNSNSGFVMLQIDYPVKATDDNFDGFAEAEVSGINSYVFNDTLIDIKWMRGSEEIASGISATLTLPSGTNEITAKAILTSGNDVSKKFAISVAAVWTTVSGEVNSSFTQAGDGRYIYTSSNKNIYLIDSTATISAAYLTGGVINSSVAVSPANLVFAGAMDARVYAFDLSLNSIWDKSIGGEISTTPSISHDNATLYITTNNGMLKAVDPLTGQAIWNYVAYGSVFQTPLYLVTPSAERVIYFIAKESSGKSYLYAVKDHGTSAELLWKFETLADVNTTPAIMVNGDDAMIYFGDLAGNYYRVNYDGTFHNDWTGNIGGKIFASPVVDEEGLIYFVNDAGVVAAFPWDFTTTTTPIYSTNLSDGVIGTPAFGTNGSLYLGSKTGYLYALKKSSTLGNIDLIWSFKGDAPIKNHLFVTESGLIFTLFTDKEFVIFKDPISPTESVLPKWATFKGNNLRSKVIDLTLVSVGKEDDLLPVEFALDQNFPNPFNPSTLIKFALPSSGHITLDVFNSLGEKVTSLIDGMMEAGFHSVAFDATHLPSGIYFYQISTGTKVFTKKMVLLK